MDTIETLVAFANTSGGIVLIGVTDSREIKGVSIQTETIPLWTNEIKTKTLPAIIPTIEKHIYKNKTIISIGVQEFPVKPIAFRGRYFKRVNNANHQLTPIEITDMSLQSLQLSWDSYMAQNITLKDLDKEKVIAFSSKVNSTGRFNLSGYPEEDLKKLRLINDVNVSNAALLLFAKDEIIYNIHLGRFKTPSVILDDKILRVSLFDAVEETMKYIISHIKFAFEITGATT